MSFSDNGYLFSIEELNNFINDMIENKTSYFLFDDENDDKFGYDESTQTFTIYTKMHFKAVLNERMRRQFSSELLKFLLWTQNYLISEQNKFDNLFYSTIIIFYYYYNATKL